MDLAINRVLIGTTKCTSCAVIIVAGRPMTITFRKCVGSGYANLFWLVAAVILVIAAMPAHAQTPRLHRVVYTGVALAFHMPEPGVCTRSTKIGTRFVSDVHLLHLEIGDAPPFPRGSTALLEVAALTDTGAYPVTMRVLSLTILGREYRLSSRNFAFPDPEQLTSGHLASGASAGRCVHAGTVLMGDLSSDTLVVQRP